MEDIKHDSARIVGKVISRYKDPKTGEYIPGSEQVDYNKLVDGGAVELVKWLANSTPVAAGAFHHVGIGSTATAAAHGNTALGAEYSAGGYARIIGTQSVQAESSYGNKVYQVIAEFPAVTGRSAVAEMGIFDAATTGTMLIRLVFSPVRDNESNTLEITYKLTIEPVP